MNEQEFLDFFEGLFDGLNEAIDRSPSRGLGDVYKRQVPLYG